MEDNFMNRIDKEGLVKFCFSKYPHVRYRLGALEDRSFRVEINKEDKETAIGNICVQLENRHSYELVRFDFEYNAINEIVKSTLREEREDKRRDITNEYKQYLIDLKIRELKQLNL